ncbi:MAG: efflux RND transporter periplasmic adaptor subunit [Bacillota bacterium]
MQKKRILVSIISILIISLVLTGCSGRTEETSGSKEESTQRQAPVVETTTVKRSNLTDQLSLSGELEAVEEVNLSAESAGVVRKIKFKEGEEVSRGQSLIVLDRDLQKAQVREAKASLRQAETELANLTKDYQRIKKLHNKGVVSESKYDETKSRYESAQAQVEQAQAALHRAKVELDKRTIDSPFNGVVNEQLVEVGEFANPGESLAYLVQLSDLEFAARISTRDLTKVKQGQQVKVRVDSYPTQEFSGEITQISSVVESSNRGIRLKIALPNRDHLLKPGMFATGELEVANLTDVMVIPAAAVRKEEDNNYVLVVEDGTVKRREVKLGIKSEELIRVKSGLSVDEKVVVRGPANLESGTEVRSQSWGEK